MSPAKRQRSGYSGSTALVGWIALLYCALVAYGTLFPVTEWSTPALGWTNPITATWPEKAPRADLFVNLLAYLPLGLFSALWLRPRLGLPAAVLLAAALGSGLSFALEVLQSALPSRVPSPLDWAANSAGTVLGALLAAAFDPNLPTGRKLLEWRKAWFVEGRLANFALVIISVWLMTQAAPFVPSLDWGNLKDGLKPLGNTLNHPASFRPIAAMGYGLQLLALGFLALNVARRPLLPALTVLSLLILLYKVPVVGRHLSAEVLAGWAAAMVLLRLPMKAAASRTLLAIAALLAAHALSQFEPGRDTGTYVLNWIPFKQQVGTLVGMSDILETLWPFMAIGLLLRLMTPWRWRAIVAFGGGIVLALFAFALEWMQQSIPGRFADITDVLIATLGWSLPWLLSDIAPRSFEAKPVPSPQTMRWALPGLIAATLTLGFSAWLAGSQVRMETDDRGRAMLPAPENLAAIALPGFRHEHPRLPHPNPEEILRLHSENPGWLDQTRRFAGGGKGHLWAVITMAYIEPGSQDLALLHERLMAMKYSWRGHDQAKPIAQAYDWLYHQWTEDQRESLREKLAEGVAYLVNYIRKDRLSPYNVYLYNSPFQALMASNLALYGDDPRGELYMRFTYDLWKNRVLPVWGQVMGQNGGWHEGGEYVGIGIGQAIYQVPAMWRSATGEDLFKTEPGIRGFLDFAVYRKRPDGTDFRWGDAGFFDRTIPDLTALALEYRHAPAYNIRPPKIRPEPSSWPWGPLTDASLIDANANQSLPLARYFDGLGMVVARSDWGNTATYLTFKAGNNYWSHSHLDQGAFTLYKGGGLALDSGFYGPKYGSDHHMNYSYQSIAHNLITVTDPADNAPSSGKEVREIANDGGQRRIGSGWGLESAPIDLNEWLDKRTLYHTGTIERYFEDSDSMVVISDVTPAYTNARSGVGEFSHRPRRVERMWRTLIYDRYADVVIIRDVVHSTRPEFRKRWLLHTQYEPQLMGSRFTTSLPFDPSRAAGGGSLTGYVLLPEQPLIQTIGGPGFEFWADGRNYDENGTLNQFIAKKGQPTEAGAWRIELSPSSSSLQDEFLVVLVPRIALDEPRPEIRRVRSGESYGVEVHTRGVSRQWWFEPNQQSVRFASGDRNILVVPAVNASADESWWAHLRAWWRDL